MPEGRAAGIPESESSDPSFPANSCAILNAVVSSVLVVTFKFKVVFLWVLFFFTCNGILPRKYLKLGKSLCIFNRITLYN